MFMIRQPDVARVRRTMNNIEKLSRMEPSCEEPLYQILKILILSIFQNKLSRIRNWPM